MSNNNFLVRVFLVKLPQFDKKTVLKMEKRV